MLTIDEYIAKMKRADKMDEFDYLKQSENMAAVILRAGFAFCGGGGIRHGVRQN